MLGGGRPAVAAASGEPSREGVLVTGTGAVFGEPDLFTAEFAVETEASTVGDALERANTAATRMRNALVRAGIARADLQTSNVGISSKFNDDRDIIGYSVNQGLTAKIRNLPRAGAVLSAGIAAGGNAARLNGVSFSIENDTALLAEARKKAFADARGKAELYAKEAGRPLGRVVTISEVAPTFGPPSPQYSMAAYDARVPLEPGKQQLTATVTVEWALAAPAPVTATLARMPAKPRLTNAQRAVLVEATSRFRDVKKAIAAGYRPTKDCVPGMGFHYAKPELTGDMKIDPALPEILVYTAAAGGSVRLAALEYFKADADGNLKTADDRPTLLSHPFDGPMAGHPVPPGQPPMPVHYDLHVWLYQNNPAGELTSMNPDVTCQ
ncbi:hypothetical protein Ate02nite_00810 [Paractinoplanes tereljensis]|uniref:DUF541 domain-containing protein n=1 Tax=Paractinoplanes tereljensis TaxID=571912 RepID=A0A919NG29_9ACTN|nr:hypothetical protein Ate02nite_00810 [Actinoplanes tereljensis]